MALLRLKKLYRAAGLPMDSAELPDHLTVMLAFAALAPAGHGEALLAEHRPAIELLRLSLHDLDSPYAHVLDAIAAVPAGAQRHRARRGRAARARGPARGGGRPGALRAAGGDAERSARMSAGEILLWIILPYAAMATFVVGTWWRYRADQFGWTSGSTQLFEQKILGWAGPAFHYGALAAVGGHVIGLMIPKSFTEAVGMSEHTYRWFSAIAGAVAGAVCVVGFVGLVYRRITNVRVRRTTSRTDLLVYFLLVVLIGLGLLDDVRAQPDHRLALRLPRLDLGSGGARCSSCSPTSRPSRAPTPSTRCTRSSPGRSGRCSRSAGSCTPGASRCSTSAAPTSSTGAATRRRPTARDERTAHEQERRRNRARARHARVHGLLLRLEPARPAQPRPPGRARPLGLPDLGDGRRPRPARLADADPARVAHRPPRRPARVHRADGLHAAAADRARALPRLARRDPRVRLPARLRRRVVRRRRAVRQRLVPTRAPRLRARHLRHGDGRHRARRPHRPADRRPLGARRPVLGRHRPDGRDVRRLPRARARRAAAATDRSGARHVRRPLGVPDQRPRVGAHALLLHGLRRLRRHVPLPAQAAHRRARPHQGRRRRPRRRLRAARRHRPARWAAGSPTASAPPASCSSRSSPSPCSPSCSPPPTRRWSRSRSPA